MTLFVAQESDAGPVVVRTGENTLEAARQALLAAGSADAAALSAATAEAASGPTYASTAAGLAATTNGQAFAVDAGGGLVSVYLNSAGTAVLQRTLATTTYLASSAGAGAVGYIAPISGAVADTVAGKLGQTFNILDVMSASLRTKIVARTATSSESTAITAAFNTIIASLSARGGGVVYVPAGYYPTNGNIKLLDDVYIVGDGYGSDIYNNATSGFSKCVIVSGNIGDPNNSNSLFDEVAYDIDALSPGDFEVPLVNAGDAANFAVGDVVGISSFEVWTPPAGTKPKWLNVNEVVGISGSTLKLRYPVADTYTSSAGNRATIRTLSGTINGYDGQPLWMSKNCGAQNLRLRQATGLSSGWYALFPCGVNQQYERIWMDDCSTMVGSNAITHSTFRDMQGRFEAGFLDFAEWQNNLLVENVHGVRFAANANLNRIGLSNNNGTDNTFRNITASLGGYGRFSLTKVFRGRFENCRVVDAGSASDPGSTEAILLGYGTDCEAVDCDIVNQYGHGVYMVGERHRVMQCRIPSCGASSYSVYATAGVNVGYVHDNEFGAVSSILARDRFFQQFGTQSPNMKVYNNTGYVEDLARQGAVVDATFVQTNQTGSYATLKTANIKGRTGLVGGFKITAGLTITGTTSTKVARIRLGANTVIQANITAAPSGAVLLEAMLITNSADSVRTFGTAIQETAILDTGNAVIAGGMTSDTTITLEAQVANAADSVSVYQWTVEAI